MSGFSVRDDAGWDTPQCLAVDSVTDVQCDGPAEHHVRLTPRRPDPDELTVTNACSHHLGVLIGYGVVAQHHPYRANGSTCDMPGTLWVPDPNVCDIDDSGESMRIDARELVPALRGAP